MRRRAAAKRGHRQGPHLVPVSGSAQVRLEAGVHAHIVSLLREIYDSALTEPVPERLVVLLRQMDTQAAPPAVPRHTKPP